MTEKKSKKEDTEGAPPKTCFVMMPIANAEGYRPGHFQEVYTELIEPAVTEAGYECQLATSTSSAHMIHLEVVTKVATADLCICDLSTNNPNVLFEYGIRQAFDKPTVLIKDDKTHRIFDVSIFRDIEYDHTLRISNILSIRAEIVKAIKQTVEGSSDERQVFSLVKLMKLTKAALPEGDVNSDGARLTLIERQLENIATTLSGKMISADSQKVYGRFPTTKGRVAIARNSRLVTYDFGNFRLEVRPGGLIHKSNNGATVAYKGLNEFEGAPWWAFMDDELKRNVLDDLQALAPDFLPF